MHRLGHALRRKTTVKRINYAAGQVGSRAGTVGTLSVDFATTLGGASVLPKAGDLVIITSVVASAGRNQAQAISGYTALGQLNFAANTVDVSMNVSYKFMETTPDTSFTLPSTGNALDAQAYTVQVFSGVDQATPMDVTPVSVAGSGSTVRPNPGANTPSTAGAWVVICGGGASATSANFTAPANFTTNFLTILQADTYQAMVGSGYWDGWTSGAVDPALYTGGSNSAGGSWAAYTLVLRPA